MAYERVFVKGSDRLARLIPPQTPPQNSFASLTAPPPTTNPPQNMEAQGFAKVSRMCMYQGLGGSCGLVVLGVWLCLWGLAAFVGSGVFLRVWWGLRGSAGFDGVRRG